MAVNPCLQHSQRWRSDFQCILNTVRNKKSLEVPIKFIRRIPKVVCTCDLDDDFLDDGPQISSASIEKTEEVNSLKEFYQNLNLDLRTKFGRALVPILKLTEDLIPEATGKIVFLNILKDAAENKYELLNREKEGGSSKWSEEDVTVPLEAKHAGLLIGRGGKNLAELRKSYKCQIHVKNLERYNPSQTELKVHLRWNNDDQENIPSLRAHLNGLAKRILQKQAMHEVAVKAYEASKRQRAIKKRSQGPAPHRHYGPVNTNIKAVSEGKFARHHTSKAKSAKKRHIEVPVLEGSHCLYCLTPYPRKIRYERPDSSEEEMGSDASEESDHELSEETEPDLEKEGTSGHGGECQFHPGYLVVSEDCFPKVGEKPRSHEWTCCHEQVQGLVTEEVKRSSHTSTGCERGRHLWHPNRKSVRDKELKSKRRSFSTMELE